jgi:hypothetical protein
MAIQLDQAPLELVGTGVEKFGAELTGGAVISGNLIPPHRLQLLGELERARLFLGHREFATEGTTPVWIREQYLSLGPVHVVGEETSRHHRVVVLPKKVRHCLPKPLSDHSPVVSPATR